MDVSCTSVKQQRQAFEAAKDHAAFALYIFAGEAQVGEAMQQGGEGDFAFEAGEGRAQAEVNAEAEREVAVLWPVEAQALRFGELRRVVVGGSRTHNDLLAIADVFVT